MKKRIIFLLLSLCFMAIVMSMSAVAAETFTYSVSADTTTPVIGDEFDVVISLTNYDSMESEIRGLQIDVANIDTSVFEVVSHSTLISDTSATSNKTSYSETNKYVRLVYLQLSGSMEKSTTDVMKLRLKVKEDLTDNGSITLPITMKIGTMSENITLSDSLTINYRKESLDFTWELNPDGETVKITRYTGTDSNVVIPDMIEGYAVTTIGGDAFYNHDGVTNITISEGITTIMAEAFYNCTSLINVTFPESLTKIGWNAFENCTSLEQVVLPNNITEIGVGTFANCINLTRVIIGSSVRYIGSDAFGNCTKLTTVVLPISVDEIDGSFRNCTSLTDIWYEGNSESQSSIYFDVGDNPILSATWHYNSCIKNVDTYTHTYGEWIVDLEPICISTGSKHRECSICENVETVEIEPTGIHVFDNDDDQQCSHCDFVKYVPGDLNGNETVTDADAIYLLFHIYFPEEYPMTQPSDMNGDGELNDRDAAYLLLYSYFPEDYPLPELPPMVNVGATVSTVALLPDEE